MDNDGVHKFAYRHRQMVADLLWLAAPAVARALDFAAAEELPTEGVRAGAGGLVQHRGDMAWCIPFKPGGQQGVGPGAARPLLVVALEFQSTIHRRMGQRMRTYGTLLRQRVARRGGGQPWLLPLVLYNGNDRWTAPGFAQDLPPLPSTAAERFLAPYQGWDYVLYSLERMRAQSGGTLAHLPLGVSRRGHAPAAGGADTRRRGAAVPRRRRGFPALGRLRFAACCILGPVRCWQTWAVRRPCCRHWRNWKVNQTA